MAPTTTDDQDRFPPFRMVNFPTQCNCRRYKSLSVFRRHTQFAGIQAGSACRLELRTCPGCGCTFALSYPKDQDDERQA